MDAVGFDGMPPPPNPSPTTSPSPPPGIPSASSDASSDASIPRQTPSNFKAAKAQSPSSSSLNGHFVSRGSKSRSLCEPDASGEIIFTNYKNEPRWLTCPYVKCQVACPKANYCWACGTRLPESKVVHNLEEILRPALTTATPPGKRSSPDSSECDESADLANPASVDTMDIGTDKEAYHKFQKIELAKIKNDNPSFSHSEAMVYVITRWDDHKKEVYRRRRSNGDAGT